MSSVQPVNQSLLVSVLLLSVHSGSAGCYSSTVPSLTLQSFGDTISTLDALVDEAVPNPSPNEKAEASRLRSMGLQLRNKGRFHDAIVMLQESVKLDPTEIGGYVILGWTQHLATQRDDAQITLQEALKWSPNHIPALNALGIVYLVDGQLQPAITTHTKALELKPDNEIAAYNLSLAYQRLPHKTKAINNAILATELEPYNPHPWVALAIAHETANDTEAARRAYQQAITLDSRYRDPKYLGHLEQAGFSFDQIQLAEEIWRLTTQ